MHPLRSWIVTFAGLTPIAMRRLLWLGLSFLLLGLFIKISWELHEDSKLASMDRQILIAIARFRVPTLDGPAVDLTALGSPTLLALFTLLGGILLYLARRYCEALYLVSGSLGAGLGTFVLKHLFTRPRPSLVPRLVEVSGYSYPSGHSLAASSFYLLLMFLTWRHFQSWCQRAVLLLCTTVVIGSVCMSRLYLGVHYPSDVLSGALLGSAWVCLLTAWFSARKPAT